MKYDLELNFIRIFEKVNKIYNLKIIYFTYKSIANKSVTTIVVSKVLV